MTCVVLRVCALLRGVVVFVVSESRMIVLLCVVWCYVVARCVVQLCVVLDCLV